MNDLISRQAAIDAIGNIPDHEDGMVFEALRVVALLPPADVQPFVRCKYCRNRDEDGKFCYVWGCRVRDNDFCSYGEWNYD